jgi:hypothetical protein
MTEVKDKWTNLLWVWKLIFAVGFLIIFSSIAVIPFERKEIKAANVIESKPIESASSIVEAVTVPSPVKLFGEKSTPTATPHVQSKKESGSWFNLK